MQEEEEEEPAPRPSPSHARAQRLLTFSFRCAGHALPMPPELMELYSLYQQELETRENNEKDVEMLNNAEKILRVCTKSRLKCDDVTVDPLCRLADAQHAVPKTRVGGRPLRG